MFTTHFKTFLVTSHLEQNRNVQHMVLSNLIDLFKLVFHNQIMALKFEIAKEPLLLKHQGKPKNIVCPHLTEGDFVTVKPLRPHFCMEKLKI